jgi:hypothetical protein
MLKILKLNGNKQLFDAVESTEFNISLQENATLRELELDGVLLNDQFI